MTSIEVLALAEEFTKATGKSSEDWYALLDWIRDNKGADVLAAFLERLESPL